MKPEVLPAVLKSEEHGRLEGVGGYDLGNHSNLVRSPHGLSLENSGRKDEPELPNVVEADGVGEVADTACKLGMSVMHAPLEDSPA